MPPTPTLAEYLTRHQNYQQFVALALMLAAFVAWGIVRAGNGHGLRWSPPVWLSVAVAAVTRTPLMFQDYWYDETFTSLVVGGSWERLWMLVNADVHPPLYYATVKAFTTAFGHNDLTM
ncbi:MAG: hypothetical protein AAF125_23555, partial [Chloroflexota bacterium]